VTSWLPYWRYVWRPTLSIDACSFEEQYCRISSRSDLKWWSLRLFGTGWPNKKNNKKKTSSDAWCKNLFLIWQSSQYTIRSVLLTVKVSKGQIVLWPTFWCKLTLCKTTHYGLVVFFQEVLGCNSHVLFDYESNYVFYSSFFVVLVILSFLCYVIALYHFCHWWLHFSKHLWSVCLHSTPLTHKMCHFYFYNNFGIQRWTEKVAWLKLPPCLRSVAAPLWKKLNV